MTATTTEHVYAVRLVWHEPGAVPAEYQFIADSPDAARRAAIAFADDGVPFTILSVERHDSE